MTDSEANSEVREDPLPEEKTGSASGEGERDARRDGRRLRVALAGAAILMASAYHYRDLLAWKLARKHLTVHEGQEATVLTPSRMKRLSLAGRTVLVSGRFLDKASEREGHVGLLLGSTRLSSEEVERDAGTWRLLVYPNYRKGFPDPFDPEVFEPGQLLGSVGRFAPSEGGTILFRSNFTYRMRPR